MATILTIAIGIGVLGLIVSSVFGRKEDWDLQEREGLLGLLRRRREKLLRAIKDIDLQREAGGLSEEALSSTRDQLKASAIAVSREMDRLRKALLLKLAKEGTRGDAGQAPRIEEMVHRRRVALREARPQGASMSPSPVPSATSRPGGAGAAPTTGESH